MKLSATSAVVLALAAACAAWSQENPRATPPVPVTAATFDLRNSSVQKILRAAAAEEAPPAEKPPKDFSAALRSLRELDAATSASLSAPLAVKFRTARRFHHMDCDSFTCVAVTADGDPLYTVPRQNYSGTLDGQTSSDSWLRCQSGNDLLTTFERYDKCRGISVGLPLQWNGFNFDTPKLTF